MQALKAALKLHGTSGERILVSFKQVQFLFTYSGINLDSFLTLGENDYVQLTTALTFTSAELTDCIEFSVIKDSFAIEFTEQFTISASFGPFAANATISILNDGM